MSVKNFLRSVFISRPDSVSLDKAFRSDPYDMAIAFNKLVTLRYSNCLRGWDFQARCYVPLNYFSRQTACDRQEKGLLGGVRIAHEKLSADLAVMGNRIYAQFLQDYQKEIEEFFEALELYLKTNSIYRGKAITATREFIDLSRADCRNLIYAEDTEEELRAHLWSLIEKPELCKEMCIKPQRKILLSGSF